MPSLSPFALADCVPCSWGVDSNLKRIAVLQNVGHWHCIEAADKVEALVSEFIQGVQVVTGARVVTGNS